MDRKRQFAKAMLLGQVYDSSEIAGGKGARIRVSINQAIKNKDGTYKDKLWLNVIVWHKELVAYALTLANGDEILVEGGRIEENSFTKDGVERKVWQVVLTPFECDLNRRLGTFGDKAPPVPFRTGGHPAEKSFELPDDDLPF